MRTQGRSAMPTKTGAAKLNEIYQALLHIHNQLWLSPELVDMSGQLSAFGHRLDDAITELKRVAKEVSDASN